MLDGPKQKISRQNVTKQNRSDGNRRRGHGKCKPLARNGKK